MEKKYAQRVGKLYWYSHSEWSWESKNPVRIDMESIVMVVALRRRFGNKNGAFCYDLMPLNPDILITSHALSSRGTFSKMCKAFFLKEVNKEEVMKIHVDSHKNE